MDASRVTVLLREWHGGNQRALDELMPLVYDELQTLAAGYLRGERPGHTMRPGDLVAEVYLRLAGGAAPQLNDRYHFYAIAARAMRQVLIAHARKRGAVKRGDGERPVTFDDALAAGERPEELIALGEALEALEGFDERKARILELHYFGGLTQSEIAAALELHVNTIARDLRFAEAWVHQRLRESP